MAKPANPGQGNGNEGEDANSVVMVTTTEDTFRYEGTSHIGVAHDGALLVGKGPRAVFAATEWIHAWTEPLGPEVDP